MPQQREPVTGLLYSQIGYDLGYPMRAIVRSSDRAYLAADATFTLIDNNDDTVVAERPVEHWGEIWGSSWWVLDFSDVFDGSRDSAFDARGFTLAVHSGGSEVRRSEPFEVGDLLLYQKTVETVGPAQLEIRADWARNGVGWHDCGAPASLRELNSHATTVIGLCDLVKGGERFLWKETVERINQQIIHGCDYIALCQDAAVGLGMADGAVIHEINGRNVVLPGNVAQSVVALATAAKFLSDVYPQKAAEYRARAIRAYRYLLADCTPFGPDGFSALNHGAPHDYTPTDDFMTRDLLMMCRASVRLAGLGVNHARYHAIRFAREVVARQVPEEAAEDGLWGHFYTFADAAFTEKAFVHHHVGHDTGGVFPYYVLPLLELAGMLRDHPEAPLWRETVRRFAYGYFLPACLRNPFRLLPEGVFGEEGLLTFCGPWHGFNVSYGFAASMAARFEMAFDDRQFRQIVAGNLQWIAGLNAGITRASIDGCVRWKPDIPEGVALPYSQIHGIGQRFVGNWTGIPGTIVNGFDTNPQFKLTVEPTRENDGPFLYTDEDWIPHAAGWLSAMSTSAHNRWFRD
jgi:hypothetical protein